MSKLHFRLLGLIVFLAAAHGALVQAGQISLEYDFEHPAIEDIVIEGIAYQRIIMPKAPNSGRPGQPALPAAGARILLPLGADVEKIEVIPEETTLLERGGLIEPIGQPYPLSADPADISAPVPDQLVYSSNRPFPDSPYKEIGIQTFRGYRILIVKLRPVQYLPASGDLYYHPRLRIIVTTVDTRQDEPLLRGLPGDEIELADRVDNPQEAVSYGAAGLRLADNYDLLILTTPELAAAFQPLKDYHDANGMPTEIHTTADVGGNNPDMVRDYIRDRYINDGIEYLLIGGDDHLIPAKDLYVVGGGYTEYGMPADLYFGCLDGTFNSDGDSLWGESTDGEAGDVDLIAEVYVGRAAVDDASEVGRFVFKTIKYLDSHASQLGKVLLCGEYLGFGGVSDFAAGSMDELVNYSTANGYVTTGIPPSVYTVDRLYDLAWIGQDWPSSEMINRMNDGRHIINHLGHCNTSWALKMSSFTAVDSLTNDEHFFLYSQGCYAGQFDGAEGWAEYVHLKTDYGAFAIVMNARYGWGENNSTDGPSQRFNREFWDAVFDVDEAKPQLGRANQDSKEDNLYRIDDNCMRWCYYQLNLFGDPTIAVKTGWMEMFWHQFSDVYGDGDGDFEAGETIRFILTIRNRYLDPMQGVTVSLSCDDPSITVTGGSISLGDIAPGEAITNNDNPLLFDLPIDYQSRLDSFFVEISWNGGDEVEIIVLEKAMGRINLLLVDDDRGQAREEYYIDGLKDLRIPYDIWNTYSSMSPDSLDLLDYDLVVWFTGDYTPYPFQAGDIAAMKGYLDGGGKLFLTGQSTAAQLDGVDPDFLHDYLKTQYLKSEYWPIICAAPGAQAFHAGDSVLIQGSGSASNQYFPDHIAPLGGAVAELQYWEKDDFGAVSYTGEYQLLYFAFGFEAIANGEYRWTDRDSILIEILDFFSFQRPIGVPTVSGLTVGPGQPMNLIDHTPVISWTFIDTVIGPQQKCQVQISTGDFWAYPDVWDTGPLDQAESAVPYSGTELVDGQSYNIRIRAFNGLFWSDWDHAQMRLNSLPEPASSLQPCDLEVVGEACPQLSHRNAGDGEDDSLTYTYEIYDDPQMTSLVVREEGQPEENYTTTWTVPVELSDEEDYYWRVLADDPYESNDAWSESAAFWVNCDNQPPEPFVLLYPDSESVVSSLENTFGWAEAVDSDAFDQVTYTLKISGLSSMINAIVSAETEDTEITVSGQMKYDYTYYWRVTARDRFGSETVSGDIRTFMIHLRGDANSDNEINVGDVVYIINFVFKNGPPPEVYTSGDVNCDGTVNVGDAVFLINFIFKGGPTPDC